MSKLTKKNKEVIEKMALEKYQLVAEYMINNETDVSTSMIQRRFRTGYNTAKLLIEMLLENDLLESYQQFIGTRLGDRIISGGYITLYKTKVKMTIKK